MRSEADRVVEEEAEVDSGFDECPLLEQLGVPVQMRLLPLTPHAQMYPDARQRPAVRQQPHHYVLNGIAYDRARERLFVTGKQWDKMFQVAITPAKGLGAQHVLNVCSLG